MNENTHTYVLLEHTKKFLISVSGFLIAMMIFNTITGGNLFGLRVLWREFDLRYPKNLATWFESLIIFLCILPIHTLLFGVKRERFPLSLTIFLYCCIGGLLFLASDEMIGIHVILGDMLISAHVVKGTILEGFGWVILYLPIILFALSWMIHSCVLLVSIVGVPYKQSVQRLLILFSITLLLVICCEIFEAYVVHTYRRAAPIVTLIEESAELITMYLFYSLFFTLIKGTSPLPHNRTEVDSR